ncbi:PAC2 family protein [Corynebacterium cystitidis]|uniref:PAC2 family protein n=1 Tax=Corynebacterium cystitidis TaxID=35757 RepID=UPI00211DB0A3|nr:PAC2 family protein [Corynebacterium cystitidis]
MADDNRHMYEMEYPVPAISSEGSQGESSAPGEPTGPLMVVAMQGYADAGHAVESAAMHLKAALENKQVATFNTDELIDYRSRRPAVMMDNDELTHFEELDLDIRVLRDTKGKSFLLLSGPEPDLRWNAFSEAVSDLAEKFDVSRTICLYGAPMAVPHTRPLMVSAHGNDEAVISRMFTINSKWNVPGAAQLMIERELLKRGRKVSGFTAHVPHYLAQSPYPEATYQLLQSVSDSADLELPLKSLEHDITRVARQLTEQVSGSEEIMHVVTQLEQHYDTELEKYRKHHPDVLMPGEAQVPSSEEIGQAFENYLSALDDRDAPRNELPEAPPLFHFGDTPLLDDVKNSSGVDPDIQDAHPSAEDDNNDLGDDV